VCNKVRIARDRDEAAGAYEYLYDPPSVSAWRGTGEGSAGGSMSTVLTDTQIGKDVPLEQARLHIIRRLIAKIELDPATGCWLWAGYRSSLGYGSVDIQRRHWAVHRLTYSLFKHPIPDGLQVCHRCDNPPCCNPDHLFLGTAQENALDSKAKKRHHTSAKTHCVRGHAYADYGCVRPDGKRGCKECERTRPQRIKGKKLGPSNKNKTHCIRGHALAGDNLYIKPNGERQCRMCRLQVILRIQQERRTAKVTI
jgi:hypothetical protein